MDLRPTPEELAEAPLCWQRPEPDVERFSEDVRFVLQHDPLFNHPYFDTVNRVRIEERSEGAVRAARNWFGARGLERFSWWVRRSANRPELVEELLDLGLEVSAHDPGGVALMQLEDEPPEVPGIVVREIDSMQDDISGAALFAEVFGMGELGKKATKERIAKRWKREFSKASRGFLAYLDGRAAARGNLIVAGETGALYSGATLPCARGRGCYRALVRARWDAARKAGATSLVVQAGQHSEPILASLGFRTIDRLVVLIDHC